ncbi:MAG: hypothetical protein WDZ37_05510 [Solirubrobacterales bacterium]
MTARRVDKPPANRGANNRLATAAQVAELLGVSRSYVYEIAADLGVVELPVSDRAKGRRTGKPRPRLRFELDVVERLTSRSGSGESRALKPAPRAEPGHVRSPRSGPGARRAPTDPPLLRIGGRRA